MEHLVTIDNGAPLAFDRTPFLIAFEGARGPRTPFNPERTVVPLSDTNAGEEESLAWGFGEAGRDNNNNNNKTHTAACVPPFHDVFHADFTNSTRCSVM